MVPIDPQVYCSKKPFEMRVFMNGENNFVDVEFCVTLLMLNSFKEIISNCD